MIRAPVQLVLGRDLWWGADGLLRPTTEAFVDSLPSAGVPDVPNVPPNEGPPNAVAPPPPSAGRDYVVIVSRQDYSVARDTLLASLRGKWPSNRLILVMNNEQEDRVHVDEATGTTLIHTVSNAFEYTGFLAPSLLAASPQDAFLLLHDTCKALDNAAAKFASAFAEYRQTGVNILWCSSTGQCNLAIYDVETSRAFTRRMGHILAFSKEHGIGMEHNWNDDSLKRYGELRQGYVSDPALHIGSGTPYSPGVVRQILYFPALDLEKYYVTVDRPGVHPNTP